MDLDNDRLRLLSEGCRLLLAALESFNLLLTLLQALQIILILKLTAHDLGLRPHSLQLLLQLLHCLV